MRARSLSLVAGLAVIVAAAAGGCAARREIQGPSSPGNAGSAPIPALVTRRCGGCHAVPDPARMSAERWIAGLERMKQRMELPAAEWDSLAAMAQGHGRAEP